MHLVGFIIKKFVTMHGHMNVTVRKMLFRLKMYVGSTEIVVSYQ